MSPTPSDQFRLPSGLVSLLKSQRSACMIQATDHGVALVAKLPAREIRPLHGPIPFQLTFQVYEHPAAPVTRTALTMLDRKAHPLVLEAFVNPADDRQRQNLEALTQQTDLIILFYGEKLRHRLSKRVHNVAKVAVTQALHRADEVLTTIPDTERNFEAAKTDIMAMLSSISLPAGHPKEPGATVDI